MCRWWNYLDCDMLVLIVSSRWTVTSLPKVFRASSRNHSNTSSRKGKIIQIPKFGISHPSINCKILFLANEKLKLRENIESEIFLR